MEVKMKPDFMKDYTDLLNEVYNPIKDTAGYEKRYFYKQLPEMLNEYKPIIAKHNFVLVNRVEGLNLYVELIHSSGEKITCYTPIMNEDNAQKYGSYLTYMRRYLTMVILNVAGEDDDGEITKKEEDIEQSNVSNSVMYNGVPYTKLSGVSKLGKAWVGWFPPKERKDLKPVWGDKLIQNDEEVNVDDINF